MMIIATKASGREGRTENTVGKGTSWHMWYREGTQRRVCSLFSFTGWSRAAQYEWNRGRSAPGVLPAQKAPVPLLRGMRNGHLPSLLISKQMRCESPIGVEPGAWARGCLKGSLIR